MVRDYTSVDISTAPELARLAEAMRRTGKLVALKQGAETLAIVRPVPKRARAPRSPAGALTPWRGKSSPKDDPAAAKSLAETRRPARERKAPSRTNIEAALATAGAWRGLMDPDELKQRLREEQWDEDPAPTL